MKTRNRIINIDKGDYFECVNLHMHSNFSDGKEDFDSLVEQALRLGLEHFAICDHNTVEGYKKTKYKNEPALIPAAEFDCRLGHCLLHILAYGIDVNSPEIASICAKKKSHTKEDITRIFHSRHPKVVIKKIHDAGGIAVLAHPCCCWVFNLDAFVKKLVNYGLDGIEVYYPYRRFRGVLKFHRSLHVEKIAQKYDLIKTGGTDEHKSLE